MPKIHPTAIITGQHDFGPGVEVGPGCVIDGPVTLGENVRLIGNCYLKGPLNIGANTVVYPFACLGFEPQDVKYKADGGTPGVKIGTDCIIREHVTVHAASNGKPRPTTIGNRCFLMVSAHMGHDSLIGNDVVLVNNTALGGHAELADRVTLGGGSVVHQFNRIGRLAFISGGTAISCDVPPFCMVWGRNHMTGLNLVGLRRNGISRDDITLIRQAFREVFRQNLPRTAAVARLRELGAACPPVLEMADFVESAKRSIAPYFSTARGESDEDQS